MPWWSCGKGPGLSGHGFHAYLWQDLSGEPYAYGQGVFHKVSGWLGVEHWSGWWLDTVYLVLHLVESMQKSYIFLMIEKEKGGKLCG